MQTIIQTGGKIMTGQRTIIKGKAPIKIRQKQLSNGNVSLYLDIYHNGARRYEFMKLYLLPERGVYKAVIREQNRYTLEIAEAIKAQRYREILSGAAGMRKSGGGKVLLSEWLEIYRERQQRQGHSKSAVDRTGTLAGRLAEYTGGRRVMLKDVDKSFCLGFVRYLTEGRNRHTGKPLRAQTAQAYCNAFNTVLYAAVREGMITENPFARLAPSERIHAPEGTRAYLTVDEVKKLIAAPCRQAGVKRAFLFSCFCGLRISDIRALRWLDITSSGEACRLEIIMQKTKEPLYLPLSASALQWLPERGDRAESSNIFTLPCKTRINSILRTWTRAAGIAKHVTFHVARHTFATLSLTGGADLYTTSKLLGHRNIATTQIYAKIVNRKKDEAVNAVSKLFEVQ
ncbi:MAG: site-specific integrase [Clostridium sp.]|nr:site-specific integrase [Bacteroidales bacterium]MCM1510846.1 site-specific integrase [Clostridium sp.]